MTSRKSSCPRRWAGENPTVYLDSGVFVYSVTHDPENNAKARASVSVLRDVEEGKVRGATSLLTWDELTWVVWKLKGLDAGIRAGSALLRLQNLILIPVGPATTIRAQELVERYQLKPRDAIHVSTAIASGERDMVSDDADFDAVKEVTRRPLA